MKMRKILPLVILAVGALFLLSGCDAILDAIFPTNQITVNVWALAANHTDFAIGGYVTTTVVDINTGTQYQSSATWSSYDGRYAYYTMIFTKLKDDTFAITSTYVGVGADSYSYIYDSTGTVLLGTSITMPYKNYSSDSTGHSITVVEFL